MSITPYMPSHTPAGDKMIDKLLGDPDEVTARGQQIIDLGSDMAAAWSLISRLAADGAEMEGQSIDKLRELCEKVERRSVRSVGAVRRRRPAHPHLRHQTSPPRRRSSTRW